MRLAITGASGYIGSAVVRSAVEQGISVRAIVRCDRNPVPGAETVRVSDLLRGELPPLDDCDALINCAARVHVLRETHADPEAAYRSVNVDLPARLLRAAASSGVRRFVQLSSVSAVTSQTPPDTVVDDYFPAAPQSLYGQSKLSGDIQLLEMAGDEGISVVSLRPPAVFGPGVGAHFRMLMRAARLGMPLPIGGIENRRSFMFLDNLSDAVLVAASRSSTGCYIVTDSPPISTAELYRSLLRLYRRPVILPRLPTYVLTRLGHKLLGDRYASVSGNAAYSGSRFAEKFGWAPPIGFARALEATVGSTL